MAGEDDDEDLIPLLGENLTGSGSEDEEAMIALLKATSTGGPGKSSPAAAFVEEAKIQADAKIQAIVQEIAEKNRVLVGLVTVGNPEARTSITLAPEDALRMAERIFQAALKLPQPPKPDALRAFLGGIAQAVQEIPKATVTEAKPKTKKPKSGKSKTGKS